MPHPTCVSRPFPEKSRERVRESAPGCGPEFTSRTPSGWPGLGASCRLDESASAAGGGRRRRPQMSSDRVTPKPSRPGTTAATGPGCPPRLLDARPGQTHPIRNPAVSPCSSSDAAGARADAPGTRTSGRRAELVPGSPAEWGVRWVTWSRRLRGGLRRVVRCRVGHLDHLGWSRPPPCLSLSCPISIRRGSAVCFTGIVRFSTPLL